MDSFLYSLPSVWILLGFLQITSPIYAPDIHWAFEKNCEDHCRICNDPVQPAGGKYRLHAACSNNSAINPDVLVDGFIGKALFLDGIQASVNDATESCITDLDKKAQRAETSLIQSLCIGLTLSFWLNLTELPSSSSAFLFRTATFGGGQAPETVGIGIAILQTGAINAYVQAPGVFFEATSSENLVKPGEWTHLTLSWASQPLNILINGTSVAANTRTGDVIKPERSEKEILFGHTGRVNFTIDEVKIWFNEQNTDEVFQDAVTPPTPPPTTTQEETTQDETTITTASTMSSTTAMVTTTPPFYVDVVNSKLAKVSKELYDNEVTNSQTNFTTSEVLTLSSEKTIEVNDNLADVIIDEDIDLDPELAISYITTVSENTQNFVATKNAETWRQVSEVTEVLNEIIENADNVTNTIVKSIEPSENITEIQRVNAKSVSIMIVPTQTEKQLTIQPSSNVEIGLPSNTVSNLAQNEVVVVAASVHSGAQDCYHDLSPDEVDIIPRIPENGNGSDNAGDAMVFKDISTFQIITEIVSVNIKPKPVNQEIRLSFRHIRDISTVKNFTLYCAYIDKSTSRWTHHKCNIIETNNTHTTFISNHLTNFAILMQVVDFEIKESDRKNLELITYIGLSISVFCLVLSLCIFALVNNVRGQRTERYHLHANLALGMLLGQVTFLAGSGRAPGTDQCKATAILLHFFYLTSFSWMLVEGFHLYNLVVKAFKSSQNKLGYYYMIGWGLPLLICVISVAAAFDGYGERVNCWLDMNNSRVIWAFVGPVLFVITINVAILIKVTKVISSLAKSRDNCIDCMTDAAAIAVCVKAVAVLMPILGVTWIFGVIAVNQELIVFQYIFAIFNSLQGFFLFVFHCVFNSETRSTFMYRTKSLRSDAPSKSSNFKGRRGTKINRRISPRTSWNRTAIRQQESDMRNIPSTSSEPSQGTSSSQSSEQDVRPTRTLIRTHRSNNASPMIAW